MAAITWKGKAKNIDKNGSQLLQMLGPVLEPNRLAILVENEIIRDYDKNDLLDKGNGSKRCKHFLVLLRAGSVVMAEKFCQVMRDNNNEHIANLILPPQLKPISETTTTTSQTTETSQSTMTTQSTEKSPATTQCTVASQMMSHTTPVSKTEMMAALGQTNGWCEEPVRRKRRYSSTEDESPGSDGTSDEGIEDLMDRRKRAREWLRLLNDDPKCVKHLDVDEFLREECMSVVQHFGPEIRKELEEEQMKLIGPNGLGGKPLEPRLLTYLKQWGVLEENELQALSYGRPTPSEQVYELLPSLQSVSDGKLILFARALMKTGKRHLLKCLKGKDADWIGEGDDKVMYNLLKDL